jgi:P27 family predicted phage terminase small subunit
MTAKQKKLHSQIITLLKSKNLYEESDQILIAEIFTLLEVIDAAKKSIKRDGIMVNVRADGPPLMQVNQAVSVHRDGLKSLVTIVTKLGISPQERSKLKLIEKETGFDINSYFNEH